MPGHGLAGLELVLGTLQYLVVRDWQVFEPHARSVTSQYRVALDAWGRFEWLAAKAMQHLEREQAGVPKRPKQTDT